VNRFSPEHTLELGTSLGITTLYLSLPKQQNQIITLEGCPETAALALANFRRLKRTNIELLSGEFSDTLPLALKKLPRLDLVYFDGNHRKEPTLNYFETCLPQATEDSIFIFDDIHWDPGMESAWEEIKKHHRVSLTIDLFELGLVFFRRGMVKQDFVLKY
jgi:predicted O-methyltransferase YrrM